MTTAPVMNQQFSGFFERRSAASRRQSSWDRTGANQDFLRIGPGETVTLMDESGPGCITHFYCAMVLPDITDYRDAIIRCYWDGAAEPSVAVPLGDFFGVAHGRVREFTSTLASVNDGLGSSHGLNAYFPMPFADGARITLENRGDEPLGGALGAFWYHVDYEVYPDGSWPRDDVHRFHGAYRQERPTVAVGEPQNITLHDGINIGGAENYVALDTVGEGRMVGLHLQVENIQGKHWYGEGDDMVFIDGEEWPPSIHGTGSEEIFGGGACPSREYAGLYTGFHLIESDDYDGLVGMYRWFVHDPIHFATSLRWTIEHGHANNFENNYASVAYWYQTPQRAADPLPSRDEMRPRLGAEYVEARDLLFGLTRAAREARQRGLPDMVFLKMCQAGRPFYLGNWEEAIEALTRFKASSGL